MESWSYNAQGRHAAAPQEPYTYQEYPKVLYAWAENSDGWVSCVVQNDIDEASLGDEWVDNPAKCAPPAAEASSPPKGKK